LIIPPGGREGGWDEEKKTQDGWEFFAMNEGSGNKNREKKNRIQKGRRGTRN
jgi:hypothetical protein